MDCSPLAPLRCGLFGARLTTPRKFNPPRRVDTLESRIVGVRREHVSIKSEASAHGERLYCPRPYEMRRRRRSGRRRRSRTSFMVEETDGGEGVNVRLASASGALALARLRSEERRV